MSSNTLNQSPLLRTSRSFPQDSQPLSVEINRSYVDIAEKMNDRTIGLFPTNKSIQNGEKWYLTASKVQSAFRQVYPFTSAGNIAHGLKINQIGGFTRIYGTFTDGTNWYPLPYVDINAASNQVSIMIDPTNIEIIAGGGAPSITSGMAILEWLSNS